MNPTRAGYFVTGTDTGVGKTLVSTALLHLLTQDNIKAVGMKPVSAGTVWRAHARHNEDVDALGQASNVRIPTAWRAPYILRQAVAPHIAAARERIVMNSAYVQECYKKVSGLAEVVIVEGVGGFRVPLSDHWDTADMAEQFNLPIILVVGLRLGCLSQALLTAEAIAARGLVLAGWVANQIDTTMAYPVENIETLKHRLAAPLLGTIPRLSNPAPSWAAEYLNLDAVSDWPVHVQEVAA